jgi:hypothetical protein
VQARSIGVIAQAGEARAKKAECDVSRAEQISIGEICNRNLLINEFLSIQIWIEILKIWMFDL